MALEGAPFLMELKKARDKENDLSHSKGFQCFQERLVGLL